MASVLRCAGLVAGATGLTVLLPAAPAAAHETWFVHHPESYPLEWSALLRPSVLTGLVAVALVALAWRRVAQRVGTPELTVLRPLGRLAPWAPRLLGLHLGVSLLLLTLTRSVLDPSVTVPDGALGTALLVPQAVAGALLVVGRGVRAAAWGVVAAGPVLLALAGISSMLMCLVLLGIALFLVLLPPSHDLHGAADLDERRVVPALLALRAGTAGSLIVLAVVEKLANPAMGEAMLDQEPVLNLLAPLGMSSGTFILLAGLVEVLFGLLVLSGAAPQVVALVAAVPFSASLLVFGGTELMGHLPVYGVLLALLLLGSSDRTAPLVPRLVPVTGAATAAGPRTFTPATRP